MKKKFLSILMSSILLCSVSPFALAEETQNDTAIILHTNDTHCAIENGFGFAGVSAYEKDMVASYGQENVTLVDAGDFVQGGAVGKLTQGTAIIELMNDVGYDVVTLGNHEFDYKVPQALALMGDLDAKVVSSNFVNLPDFSPVYDAYTMINYGDFDVAYVGITTPETFTKSTPAYFQNENGDFIYGFCEDSTGETLYRNVQASVDSAISAGAEYVVAVAHLGVDSGSSPYRSTDVIANTNGIDIVIDGHSHSKIVGQEVSNKDGKTVLLSQTGDKFNNLGKITIDNSTQTITTELISSDEEVAGSYTKKDPEVQAKVDEINAKNDELLNEVIAHSEVSLVVDNPETGKQQIIRCQETNLGDFCADAYRTLLGADVAIVNGGGIRASIEAGEITYGDTIAVHPWGNNTMSMKVTGQQILDALEMGAKAYPSNSGGFLQVSGMTYSIQENIESSVVTDDKGSFVKVDGPYRVTDVKIAGESLELTKEYSLASHDYLLKDGGDGMSMFQNCEIIKDQFMIDNEVLIDYVKNTLGGVIGEEYSNINGQGRISIVVSEPATPETGDSSTLPIMVVSAFSVLAILVLLKKKA